MTFEPFVGATTSKQTVNPTSYSISSSPTAEPASSLQTREPTFDPAWHVTHTIETKRLTIDTMTSERTAAPTTSEPTVHPSFYLTSSSPTADPTSSSQTTKSTFGPTWHLTHTIETKRWTIYIMTSKPFAAATTSPLLSIITKAHPHRINSGVGPSLAEPSE